MSARAIDVRVCRLHGQACPDAAVYHYWPGVHELHPGESLALCRLAVRQLSTEDPDGRLVFLHP